MKVYTKVTIDMRTFEEVELECHEYSGPITECKKGGGGGGGGGGGSGKISFPAYMEAWHTTWLANVATYMGVAISGDSPYASAAAYDPDTNLTAMDAAITAFNTVVDALDPTVDYNAILEAVKNQVDANVVDTTRIDGQIEAYTEVLNVDYNDMVAKLQSASCDIGSGMVSSFVMAQGDLYAKKERDLDDFGGRLYVEAERQRNSMISIGVGDAFRATLQRVQFEGDVARLTADAGRIRIVAKGEETRENYEYDEMDVKWDLEMTSYGTGMLSAIGGGVVKADPGKMSRTQSALSGALSGAAMGGMIGGPVGAGIGAGIGFVLSLF